MADHAREFVRLYANVENYASITCPQCQHVRVANVEPYIGVRKPLKIKCRCGLVFHAILETRRFYRKQVNLQGHYAKLNSRNTGPMIVENLSMSGLGFRLRVPHTIEVGDRVRVRFVLDNRLQTEIVTDITVRIVIKQATGTFIGGEFCNITASSKELAWYLHPG
jgi:uncharacterized Fe-S cluster-containing radical SAM superfamily enzyme